MADLGILHLSNDAGFRKRVDQNQHQLASSNRKTFDFIVCGAGSSGSVVAGRLAENPAVRVLLLEAGGSDDIPEISDPEKWFLNLGTNREWGFHTEPHAGLNGRTMPYTMGRALGGGSSINVGVWSRGHKNDWDYFAEESGDVAWGYDSVLRLYHRIEDFHGLPDPLYRGEGGPIFLENSQASLRPFNRAALEAMESRGMVRFDNPNGGMMEGNGGCSTTDRIIHRGSRQSVFRSYALPKMVQANLTVLTDTLVTRLLFDGKRVIGVEATRSGSLRRFIAQEEVILSMGAVQTPKLLMQSGIGDEAELSRFRIPTVQHLPGVGRNLQDHPSVSCIWEFAEKPDQQSSLAEAVAFWKSDSSLPSPDLLMFPLMVPYMSAESTARLRPKPESWSLACVLLSPKSRGRIRLSGAAASDPARIEARILSDHSDVKALAEGLKVSREIGCSSAFGPYRGKEVMPGRSNGFELEELVGEAASNFSHQASTAKMGTDAQSVVNADLKVYGVDNLRVADASVLPRTMTGNTMAACVVVGERMAEMLASKHQL
jgi:choline dehydrogenase